MFHRRNSFRPAWRIVGQIRNYQLGELWGGPGVGDLATDQDGNTVAFRISQRHGGTHGIAVAAEHAAVLVNRNTLYFFTLAVNAFGGLNSTERACGNRQGQLADRGNRVMVDQRRLPVDSKDRDVGAVNRTAHVQAAGQSYAHLGRQAHAGEVLKQFIHNGLDHTGSIGGRSMAVDPALGMDDIGHAGAGAADRHHAVGVAVINQGLHLVSTVHHEFNVVTGGETQVAVTMLVSHVTVVIYQ